MSDPETEVVVVSAARTPIGKQGGYYNDLSAEDLGVLSVREAIERSGIDLSSTRIDQVVAGMIYTDSKNQQIYLPRNVAMRVARQLGDTDNLNTAPGKTTQRICGTGFQTVADAYDLICAEGPNKMNCVISFGTESMSQTNNIHQGRRKRDSVWEFEDAPIKDQLLEGFNHYLFNTMMPATAEKYGLQQGITRQQCDEFAVESHTRSKNAQLNQWNRYAENRSDGFLGGCFDADTTDQRGKELHFWRDEGTRYDIDMDKLARLPQLVSRNGLITPGNASQISDGSAAVMLMDRKAADENNISYIAKIRGYQFSTVDPTIMGQGPVPAVRDLLEKLNLKMSDIDLFEVNEAFAAQYLAVEKELGLPGDVTNVNGGAIAIGHNIAATGLRITIDMIYELKRRGQSLGIASACIGGGQGGAVLVEILH